MSGTFGWTSAQLHAWVLPYMQCASSVCSRLMLAAVMISGLRTVLRQSGCFVFQRPNQMRTTVLYVLTMCCWTHTVVRL